MAREIVVNLASNSRYWQASWKDASGRRCKKSLGRKSKLSRRQARKLCQQIAGGVSKRPGLTLPAKSPLLGTFADAYIRSRTDLKPGTLYLHRLTRKYLAAFFGEELPIDRITRATAREWQVTLAAGQLSGGTPLAAPTVRGHVVNAKAILARAVDDDLIAANPFAHLSVPVPKVDKDWHYVSIEELDKLLNACRTLGWKALIALCRLAGLRRGEALQLPWTGVGPGPAQAERLRREDRQKADGPHRSQPPRHPR